MTSDSSNPLLPTNYRSVLGHSVTLIFYMDLSSFFGVGGVPVVIKGVSSVDPSVLEVKFGEANSFSWNARSGYLGFPGGGHVLVVRQNQNGPKTMELFTSHPDSAQSSGVIGSGDSTLDHPAEADPENGLGDSSGEPDHPEGPDDDFGDDEEFDDQPTPTPMTDSGDLGPNHSAEPGSDQFDLDFGARVMEQGGLTSSVLDGSDDSDGSGGQSHVSSVTEDQPPAEDMRPPVDLASIEPFAPRFLRDPTR